MTDFIILPGQYEPIPEPPPEPTAHDLNAALDAAGEPTQQESAS